MMYFIARLSRSRRALFGMTALFFLIVVAIFAQYIAPFSPNAIAGSSLAGPSSEHLLGTDNVGRDVFSILVYGTRSALMVGLFSASLALLLGALMGGAAAYFGGWREALLMRIVELFQILPLLVLALVVVALWGVSVWSIIFSLAIAIWPLEARIVYAQVKTIREREYVQAAKVAGLSTSHILFKEILPNALPPVIIQITLDAGLAVLIQAGLGFLGLDDPMFANWGQVLNSAQDYIDRAWWMSVFPGIALCVAVLAFAFLGDGLNEIFNPRFDSNQRGLNV